MRVDLDIGCPPGWVVHDEPVPGVAVALTGPGPTPSGFPPTITVGVEPVGAPTAAGEPRWPDLPMVDGQPAGGQLERAVDDLRTDACRHLTGAAVEEEGVRSLTGRRAGYLRLVHTVDGHDLSAELWTWRDGDVVWTLTATVDRGLWEEYAALFERVAASWRP